MRKSVFIFASMLLAGCSHDSGGKTMAAITACPDKPNCVSSVATDEEHRIEPFQVGEGGSAAMERLKQTMAAFPRTKLIKEEPGYLHYEVTSRLMRFKDDVEFGLVEEAGLIDVRSASRVGFSDLGVNRKRVEEIRKRFEN